MAFMAQIRDLNGNVISKHKTISEAVEVAEKLRVERKETLEIWDNKPYKKTANFYEYGYHLNITLEYHKTFWIKVDNDEWSKVSAKNEETFYNLVNSVKKYSGAKIVETRID